MPGQKGHGPDQRHHHAPAPRRAIPARPLARPRAFLPQQDGRNQPGIGADLVGVQQQARHPAVQRDDQRPHQRGQGRSPRFFCAQQFFDQKVSENARQPHMQSVSDQNPFLGAEEDHGPAQGIEDLGLGIGLEGRAGVDEIIPQGRMPGPQRLIELLPVGREIGQKIAAGRDQRREQDAGVDGQHCQSEDDQGYQIGSTKTVGHETIIRCERRHSQSAG